MRPVYPEATPMIPIAKWFDPNNKEHLKAYNHLSKKGSWPEGFIPDNVELEGPWQYELTAIMAQCWSDYMLRGKY